MAKVSLIVIGKTDTADSIGNVDPNGEVVLQVSKAFADLARNSGKRVAVGGHIVPDSVGNVIKAIRPDEVETRHVVFDVSKMHNPEKAVKTALDFELLLYKVYRLNLLRELAEKATENRTGRINQTIEQVFIDNSMSGTNWTSDFEIKYKRLRLNAISARISEIEARLSDQSTAKRRCLQ
jgi:hypothetical protein